MKALKVPDELMAPPYYNNFISLNSVNIIEACTHVVDKRGSMFLKDHMLLFVLEGEYNFKFGGMSYTVAKNEMVLLKKNISIDYHKMGNPEKSNSYDSMMFFLKEEFLIDFIKIARINEVSTVEMAKVTVSQVKEPLLSFIISVKPYFREHDKIDDGLLRIKMLELLYDLARTDQNLLLQLLQLKKQVVADISQIIEENYTSPLNLEDFAYLSGRSLSSFKRDFYNIYKVPPAKLIREKRLSKAQELLKHTALPIQDVCYASGFDSIAHFSRLYKQHYGVAPSASRQQLK